MGCSSGLFVTLRYSPEASTWDLLRALLEVGWNLDDRGRITYLLPGDADEYDWQSVGQEQREQVLLDIRRKAAAGEQLGVVISWQSSGVGGELLLQPAGMLIFSMTLDRRQLDCRVTDVSWYVERLASGLDRAPGITVEAWRWEETR